jgi:hypothetical protein
LLRIHIPNDDRLFPGRLASQLGYAEQVEPEWSVSHIVTHEGSGTDAVFQVQWGTGDRTWLPYHDVEEFHALQDYFEIIGISRISQLRAKHAVPSIPVSRLGLVRSDWMRHPASGPLRKNLRWAGAEADKKWTYKPKISASSPQNSYPIRQAKYHHQASFSLIDPPHYHHRHRHYIVNFPRHRSTMPSKIDFYHIRPIPGRSDMVGVYNPWTGRTVLMTPGQILAIYGMDRAIQNGTYDSDKFIEVSGYDQFAAAHNSDPALKDTKRGHFCERREYEDNYSIPDGPAPSFNDLGLDPVHKLRNEDRDARGELVYGPGRVVDHQGILKSQKEYDTMCQAAKRGFQAALQKEEWVERKRARVQESTEWVRDMARANGKLRVQEDKIVVDDSVSDKKKNKRKNKRGSRSKRRERRRSPSVSSDGSLSHLPSTSAAQLDQDIDDYNNSYSYSDDGGIDNGGM